MQIDRGIVAYFAPGGGLGHLNRALAVCLRLRDAKVDARIVTNSPFAEGLAALAHCPIIRLEGIRDDRARTNFVDAGTRGLGPAIPFQPYDRTVRQCR